MAPVLVPNVPIHHSGLANGFSAVGVFVSTSLRCDGGGIVGFSTSLRMRLFGHTSVAVAAYALLLCTFGRAAGAQSAAKLSAGSGTGLATISSVRMLSETNGPAVEIVSTRPVVPAISKLENPPRLVIDLPNARLALARKRIDVRTPEIDGIRLSQFQENPPVTRIVVDLVKPIAYTSEAAGNLLLVRLDKTERAAKPTAVATTTAGVRPVAAPANSAASGGTVLDGSRLAAGSSVTAGSDAAVVRLGRGGEVRVCPGTTVSVTPSRNNRSLMLAMSTGALEAHYKLEASADSIVTPDFRILLAGPGEFHYAVSADSRGNTCIQALPGNTASVVVSELLGDGTYQVKPTDQVMLHSGQLKNVAAAGPGSCGCPPPASSVLLASSARPVSAVRAPVAINPGPTQAPPPVSPSRPGSEIAALPPSNSKDVHVQVDAPFVFRADEPATAQPAPILAVEVLPFRSPMPAEPVATTVLAPAQVKPERHGFFGKLRGFFAAIFG